MSILVAKDLASLQPDTKIYAKVLAFEIGTSAEQLRGKMKPGKLRLLVKRGVLMFEPPLPPTRARRRRPRPALGHGLASGDVRFRLGNGPDVNRSSMSVPRLGLC